MVAPLPSLCVYACRRCGAGGAVLVLVGSNDLSARAVASIGVANLVITRMLFSCLFGLVLPHITMYLS